ncbi:MAG: hypothetical protein ACK4F9_05845 [Brevinematia bacterium]
MIAIFANGFGENAIAGKVAGVLSNNGCKVLVFPLVGKLTINGVEVPFVPKRTGSGGLTLSSLSNFIKDLREGVFLDLFRFIKTIRSYSNIKVAFVVGDPFLLFLVKSFVRGKPKIVFNSIYKSEIVEKHLWFEKYFIKKFVDYFVPRDRITAEYFIRFGVNTVYFGNPMVDAIDFNNRDFRKDKNLKTLLLLPGSRESAYKVMVKFLCIVESVFRKYGFLNFLCPLSSSISVDILGSVVRNYGWDLETSDEIIVIKKDIIEVICAYNSFGDMMVVSDVVLSFSGTATEQAAGFGKPNIMFFDKEVGWSRKWFDRQKILLGDNLKLFDRFNISEISNEIIYLLTNNKERERRGNIGKKLIEGIGSIERISKFLINLLDD